jgi:acyl carrier protein
MPEQEIRTELKLFLLRSSTVPLDESGVTGEFDVIESGAADSLLLFEIAMFMNARFSVLVRPEDIVAENFLNLDRMTAFVIRRRSDAPVGGVVGAPTV